MQSSWNAVCFIDYSHLHIKDMNVLLVSVENCN